MADSILLIDDDTDVLRAIGTYFERQGFDVIREPSAEAGLATFERARPDVVLLDLSLPGMDGMEALEHLRDRGASVVLLTGHGDIPTAVRAMQLGAENFLTKPIDLAHLGAAVARVADKVRLRRVTETLLRQGSPGPGLDSLGASSAMQDLVHQMRLLAQSDRTTVLIEGESGTGKGWVGRTIHDLSPRSREPFIDAALSGIPGETLDAELFGSEMEGERRTGLFDVAAKGTILLDEVADLPPELQPKLLKVLETRAFRRVGGSRELQADVRVIATTSRNLVTEVEQGRFREDLYYRLSVMPIRLPPLRDRARDDRVAVINRVFADLRQGLAEAPEALAPEAMERLLGYAFPGNVRELRNVLERAMILGRGQPIIQADQLPAELRLKGAAGERRHVPITLDDLEKQHIERTLRHHQGNRTRAAAELGISRATLINKIKRYALG
ncbi:MAG: sigma-54 dependent transcriptional regulator [Gemmatimonadales bacterium]|nr:sigma-54 dependent transcriptional regulator [Gemmatimonadales bacterium]